MSDEELTHAQCTSSRYVLDQSSQNVFFFVCQILFVSAGLRIAMPSSCEAEVGTQFRVATIDDCDATFTARLRCEAEEGARSRVVTIDDCDAAITVRCEAEVGTRFRVATLKDDDAGEGW